VVVVVVVVIGVVMVIVMVVIVVVVVKGRLAGVPCGREGKEWSGEGMCMLCACASCNHV
jgi:hypothetical protein